MPTAQEQETEPEKKDREIESIDFTIAGVRYERYGADTVSLKEASELERVYGKTFPQLLTDFLLGSVSAMRVIAWGLMTRENPELLLDNVDLLISEIDMDIKFKEEAADEDPTGSGPAPAAAPEQSPSGVVATSESSATGSASDPGNGAS